MTEELRGGEAATPNAAGRSARAPLCTLADFYDPVTMPPALAKAHAALDRAVSPSPTTAPASSTSSPSTKS